jgi:putative transcriptional regulator
MSRAIDEHTGGLSESLTRALPADANKEKLNALIDSYKNQFSSLKKLKGSKATHLKFKNDATAIRPSNEAALHINTALQKAYSTIPLSALKSELLSKNLDSIKHIKLKTYENLTNSNLLLSFANYKKLQLFDNFYSANSALKKNPGNSQVNLLNEKFIDSISGNLVNKDAETLDTSFFSSKKMLLTSEEEYGAKIKEIRKSRKLSQVKLALLAGISVLSIKKIEKGVGNPSLKTVLKINEVLNLQLAII